MKKILFLVSEYKDYFNLLSQEAIKLEVDLDIQTFENVSFLTQNGKYCAFVNDVPLEKYDLVFFRGIDLEHHVHISISEYCLQHTIKVADPAVKYQKPWLAEKNFEYVRLANEQLPLIHSAFISQSGIRNYLLQTKTSFPVVLKIPDSALGEGVFLCRNEDEVLQKFQEYKRHLVLQEYIPNDGDVRVFVIDGKAIAAIKRSSSDPTEFRNNVSKGGKAIEVNLTAELAEIAEKAANAMQYSMAGVDLILDKKNNQYKIMEINKSPQYMGIMQATGINFPALIVSFLKKAAA